MSDSIIIFYDGYCPLCLKEMAHLKRLDEAGRIELVDVQEQGFNDSYPDINPQAALSRLHAYLVGGDDSSRKLILGLDVTYHAWRLVGKGYWIAPLRWPVIRWFADKAYLWFAKNRYKISGWLTGKSRCYDCKL